MTNLNKCALVLVSTLALSATSALANPHYNDCPYQDSNCYNYQNHGNHKYNRGYRHNNIYHHNYRSSYHRMHRFLDNPKYAKDAMLIVDLADSIYAEKRVLRALENSQDVKKVRKQALTLRKLERQYYDLQLNFIKKVKDNDPELLNSSYYKNSETNINN